MYNQTGGALSNKTIRKMEQKGASKADVEYARRTQFSMDRADVDVHRHYIKEYNPCDPWREPNNFVMHSRDYQFGQGNRSPQFIGGMLSTLPQPVYMAGPNYQFHPAVAPYIVFRQ
jgi:hypothetical protein